MSETALSEVAKPLSGAQVPLERRPVFWFYGSAAIAYGVKDNAFSYLLLIFANQVLGVPGYLASLALAIAMLWDAVSDLLLGHWSDKTRSRFGRRHPFMYAALLVLPAAFYALFNPVVDVSGASAFWYILVLALVIRTGTTLFEVPSTALLPDLELDYDRRNQWLALRHGFGWYGGNGIHTVNFFFWVGAYGVAVPTGYGIYGVAGALLIAAAIAASALGTQRVAAALPPPEEPFRFRSFPRELGQIVESLRNRHFGALFFYGVTMGVAGGLGTALYLYNTTFFFGFTGPMIATTGVFVLIAPLCAYALGPRLGVRFGKPRAAITALAFRLTLYPIPFVLVLTGLWPDIGSWTSLGIYTVFIVLEVLCAIIGGVMLDSMMADVVEDSELSTRRRSEGLFFAARGFAYKAISAGGIIGAGSIVSLVGLDDIHSVAEVTNEIRLRIALAFLPLYLALGILALWIVSRYGIDRERHRNNLDRLNERRASVG
ncbi:MAG: MFS transporter [Pseudomonadales bacterium]